jgi:hypothetical protein
MRYALTEQKREIQMLRELVKAMRISNPNARAIGTSTGTFMLGFVRQKRLKNMTSLTKTKDSFFCLTNCALY